MIDLPADEIHLWLVPLQPFSAPNECADLLSGEEAARASRLLNPVDQLRFIRTRIALRLILSSYDDLVEPQQWRFDKNAHGRPQLQHSHLRFNLSHSRDVLAVAVSLTQPGVDVEPVDAFRRFSALARRYFSAKEYAELTALAEDAQRQRFYDLWTLKEAWAKAWGTGLSRALRLPRFSFPAAGEIALEFSAEYDGRADWQLWQADYGNCRVATAVAREPEQARLHLRTFEFLLSSTPCEIELALSRQL